MLLAKHIKRCWPAAAPMLAGTSTLVTSPPPPPPPISSPAPAPPLCVSTGTSAALDAPPRASLLQHPHAGLAATVAAGVGTVASLHA
ncbi:hypothetical protein PLESTB_001229100 [Pleodorina starrii]|uniref:Uncharacterized protein n=1 Tax=Pleodorina starrii TaxID=330485 RepID=A0A9W6BTY2_9CHLO|nr:hypothetical protein PLESTB_001229100 [Pleodorina starrii]